MSMEHTPMDKNIRLGKYRHYKDNLYELIDIATHSETREKLAIYRALYGEFGLWARPLSMFLETIEVEGKLVQRFQYVDDVSVTETDNITSKDLTQDERVKLFMSLFIGRDDVYAKRWENKAGKAGYSPVCVNEWSYGICKKPQIKCGDCNNKNWRPLDESIFIAHLTGKIVIGLYPILIDDTCRFLAMDFDDGDWQKDIAEVRKVCEEFGIVPAVERSRSGNGAHVWLFFSEYISCQTARKFGSSILTNAMSKRHEISFSSYDRLFPNQDTLPKGGFGNLIALPLQRETRNCGNSVFIDEDFEPYQDQWSFLLNLPKYNVKQIDYFISKLSPTGELGELAETSDKEDMPWEKKKQATILSKCDYPKKLKVVSANMIFIEKSGISSKELNHLKRLAAFRNPEFYKAQAMRLPTYDKPRIIYIAEETSEYIGVPRGLEHTLKELPCEIEIIDKTNAGSNIDVQFKGTLRDEQKLAVDPFLSSKIGVLSATTAFGKTVIGANLIAERKTNTLILVHRTQLLEQWKERLSEFLTINEEPMTELTPSGRKKKKDIIGQIGAGKTNRSGVIDIAVMQSLFDGETVKEFVKDYGMVIVDECHHVSAFSFEKILKTVNAKYVYGLTANPTRQDGHHPIIFMHCGDILYRVDAKKQAENRNFEHFMIPRFTGFRPPIGEIKECGIAENYNKLQNDENRNLLIIEDVMKSISESRNPIILSERTAHVELLVKLLREKNVKNVITLIGGNSRKSNREIYEKIAQVPADESIVIVATGKYVGEGFDLPRLDTLFLAMPISWKGTLQQYAGRLHRNYEGKYEVRVYDYVDIHISMLEKMYQKRLKGYASIGYKTKSDSMQTQDFNIIFDGTNFEPVYKNDLLSAQNNLLIVSPFLSKKRMMYYLQELSSKTKAGVKVTIVTRETNDFKDADRVRFLECINLLTAEHITVVQRPRIHQKFAVVDQKLVWYGSVNLLSYGISEESIMRLESTSIALELEKTIIN